MGVYITAEWHKFGPELIFTMNIEKCSKHDGPLAIFATVKTQLSVCKLWSFLAEQLVLGSEQLALKDTKNPFY